MSKSGDLATQIDQVASQVTASRARELIIAHEEASKGLDANANIQLLLETLMLQWPVVSVSRVAVNVFLQGDID